MKSELKNTAYHEAGHATEYFGMRVLSVDIIPNDEHDRLGFCFVRTQAWDREKRA